MDFSHVQVSYTDAKAKDNLASCRIPRLRADCNVTSPPEDGGGDDCGQTLVRAVREPPLRPSVSEVMRERLERDREHQPAAGFG